MANGYTYTLTYKCPKCRGPVYCKVNSENPAIPESTIDEMVAEIEVRCEYPGCPWIGHAGELQAVGRNLNMWTL
jgi:hypothetical protein